MKNKIKKLAETLGSETMLGARLKVSAVTVRYWITGKRNVSQVNQRKLNRLFKRYGVE